MNKLLGGLGLAQACTVQVRFGAPSSPPPRTTTVRVDRSSARRDESETLPCYRDRETVEGVVTVVPVPGKRLEHLGVRVQLVGEIDVGGGEGKKGRHEFLLLTRDLAPPGDVTVATDYAFRFESPELAHDSYRGGKVKLRYFARAVVGRSVGGSVKKEGAFWVENFTKLPFAQAAALGARFSRPGTHANGAAPGALGAATDPGALDPGALGNGGGGAPGEGFAAPYASSSSPSPLPSSASSSSALALAQAALAPVRMEVGIEDCLHIEFEYDAGAFPLRGVVTGRIYFLLVRVRIKRMELEIKRRETVGGGPTARSESETIARFEIMDGAPARGEVVPVRLFLEPYALTPSVDAVENRFSVKYLLNLVLIDHEDRRYFKQQEVAFYRPSPDNVPPNQRFGGTGKHKLPRGMHDLHRAGGSGPGIAAAGSSAGAIAAEPAADSPPQAAGAGQGASPAAGPAAASPASSAATPAPRPLPASFQRSQTPSSRPQSPAPNAPITIASALGPEVGGGNGAGAGAGARAGAAAPITIGAPLAELQDPIKADLKGNDNENDNESLKNKKQQQERQEHEQQQQQQERDLSVSPPPETLNVTLEAFGDGAVEDAPLESSPTPQEPSPAPQEPSPTLGEDEDDLDVVTASPAPAPVLADSDPVPATANGILTMEDPTDLVFGEAEAEGSGQAADADPFA